MHARAHVWQIFYRKMTGEKTGHTNFKWKTPQREKRSHLGGRSKGIVKVLPHQLDRDALGDVGEYLPLVPLAQRPRRERRRCRWWWPSGGGRGPAAAAVVEFSLLS